VIAAGLLLALAAPDPCAVALAGMRCLPAQTATVGEKWLKRKVKLERYYLDDKTVTFGDLQRCIDDGACAALPVGGKLDMAGPATVDWPRAERYCAWAGKRLPTEAEWELAQPKGGPLEWTFTGYVRASKCREPSLDLEEDSEGAWARALCGARDRLNACDGALFCGNLYRRVVKDPAKPAWRKGKNAWKNKRSHAFRCAASDPWLTRFPSRATTTKRPPPPALKPPSAEQVKAFLAIREDDLDIPECDEPGRSYLDCRDPRSYLKTNEPLLNVVLPYVENRGGGYTGVGSDQSYTLIARARSEWAWLFDYDPHVVNWHRVLGALILAAPDRAAFLQFFDGKTFKAGKAAISASTSKRSERRALRRLYRGAAPGLAKHFHKQAERPWSWLGSDEAYGYIRALYLQGRIRAFKGNMLDKGTMRSIGAAAKKLGVPVRVYYPSNAPEFWELTPAYRANVLGLPFDDESVVVQTISGLSMKTGFGQTGYWHYNVQRALHQQRLLARPGITRHKQLLYHRVKTDSPELTLTGMRSAPGR
jgi:hypothetical protein